VESVDLTLALLRAGRHLLAMRAPRNDECVTARHLDAGRPRPYQFPPMINVSTILIARRRRAIAVRAVDRV
jgi:hypothetical protein